MPDASMRIPSGTVTFLFTDIEGSTRLWEEDPTAMGTALAEHDTLIRKCVESHSGYVFKTVGDAFCAEFSAPKLALSAALAIQRSLAPSQNEPDISIKVRVAVHTGEVELRGRDYFGPTLSRLSRILSAGHGGQILITSSTAELVMNDLSTGSSLKDLGQHRF